MGQAGLTLDHDVPRVGFLPLLHVSLREGTERERGIRGERDGWVLELVGCGREGNSRRATNRRSVSAHTSTPYISSSLVCITPNRTAYAKQQPPLRPRATEEMVVDIVFEWCRGVWADVSAGGAFSRPMMTVRFLKPGSVQNLAVASRGGRSFGRVDDAARHPRTRVRSFAMFHNYHGSTPTPPTRTFEDYRYAIEAGLISPHDVRCYVPAWELSPTDATPRWGPERGRESDTTTTRTTMRLTRAIRNTTVPGGACSADSPPRPPVVPRAASARNPNQPRPLSPPSPTFTRPFPSHATTQGR